MTSSKDHTGSKRSLFNKADKHHQTTGTKLDLVRERVAPFLTLSTSELRTDTPALSHDLHEGTDGSIECMSCQRCIVGRPANA